MRKINTHLETPREEVGRLQVIYASQAVQRVERARAPKEKKIGWSVDASQWVFERLRSSSVP
jgi:hypothetical protein